MTHASLVSKMPFALILAATAGTALGQTTWANAAGGNWSNPANWNPMNVPDTTLESALLPDLLGPYAVLVDASTTVGAVELGSMVTLSVGFNRNLRIGSGGMLNNGRFLINDTASTSDAYLLASTNALIAGGGVIELNSVGATADARIRVDGANATLTIGADQTVIGSGLIEAVGGGARVSLLGTINADRSGRSIDVNGVDGTGGGVLMGTDGGSVAIVGWLAGGTVAGGVWGAGGSVDGVSSTGTNGVWANSSLRIAGGGLHNEGVFVVNHDASSGDAYLLANTNTEIDGSGSIDLNSVGATADARIRVDGANATLTIGPDQRVTGSGLVEVVASGSRVALEGTINANRSGRTIDIDGVDASGGGVLRGTGGGRVAIVGSLTGGTMTGGVYGAGGTVNGSIANNANGVYANSSIRLTGAGLRNNGVFTVNHDASSGDAYVLASADTRINGSGRVDLNSVGATADARIRVDGANATLTIAANQTISGSGLIEAISGGSRVALEGTIDADRSGRTIDVNGVDATGGGVMRGSNGGTVAVVGWVAGGSITGGVMGAGGLFDGVTATGTNGVFANSSIRLAGAGLHNNGVFTVNHNASSSDAYLLAAVDTRIDGNGTIELNSVGATADARIRVDGANATLTIAADQTVAGSGLIEAVVGGARMALEGTIDANRTGRTLDVGGIDATGGGVLHGSNGGTVAVVGWVVGGTFAGGVFGAGGSIDGTTAQGTNGVFSNSSLRVLGGGLHNEGRFVINHDSSSADAYLLVGEDAVIDGPGTLALNSVGASADARIRVDGANATLTIAENHTLAGSGLVEAVAGGTSAVLEGTLAPGHADGDTTGAIALEGNFHTTPGTRLVFDIAGTAAADYDRLIGNGTLFLDGTLELVLADGFVPAASSRFLIADVGTIIGAPAQVITPQIGEGLFRIVQTGDKIEAVWTCEPDLNGDGVNDFFDVQFFLNVFTQEALYSDYNEDGVIDFFDLLAFLNDFATGCL